MIIRIASYSIIVFLILVISGCQQEDVNSPPEGTIHLEPDTIYLPQWYRFEMTDVRDDKDPDGLIRIRWDYNGDSLWDTPPSTNKYAHIICWRLEDTLTTRIYVEIRDRDEAITILEHPVVIKPNPYGWHSGFYDGVLAWERRINHPYFLFSPTEDMWTTANMRVPLQDSSWNYRNENEDWNRGLLYTWDGAMNACPDGYRLASDEDWKELEHKLGMDDAELGLTGYRTSGSVDYQLKANYRWVGLGKGSNSSGFSSIPTGERLANGAFINLSIVAKYWTATDLGDQAWIRSITSTPDKGIGRELMNKGNGYAVRCVKKDQ